MPPAYVADVEDYEESESAGLEDEESACSTHIDDRQVEHMSPSRARVIETEAPHMMPPGSETLRDYMNRSALNPFDAYSDQHPTESPEAVYDSRALKSRRSSQHPGFYDYDGEARSFHEFENYEKGEVDVAQQTSPIRARWHERNFTLFLSDLTFGQFGLLNCVWRLPAIAFALSIQWGLDPKVSLLNYMIPYTIALVCIGYPLVVIELGISQSVRGCAHRAFASLGKACQFAGITWIVSAATLLFMTSLTAYCFLYTVLATKRMGLYKKSDDYSIETKIQDRVCVNYQTYVPYLSPLICGPRGRRLDISCLDPVQCQLWYGEGRCIASPFAPASDFLLSNAESVDPYLDSDYPQYCSARFLHDVTTNQARALMTATADWADYGRRVDWKLPVTFLIVILSLLVWGTLPDAFSAMVRIAIGLAGTVMVVLLMGCASVWYGKNHWSAQSWHRFNVMWDPATIVRPEIWAGAVVQALVTLSLGSNQLNVIGSRSPMENYNVVKLASLYTFANTMFGYMIVWICWLAYGATTGEKWEFITAGQAIQSIIRYDIRNMPYGTLFTSLQAMFDNSSKLDGTHPRTVVLPIAFWFTMFLMGLLTCHHCLEAVVQPIFNSTKNWDIGASKLYIRIVLLLALLVVTVINWFGCSWGYAITMQHFVLNWALPMIVLYEALAVGWLFGYASRAKHFGHVALGMQLFVYICGCIISALGVTTMWEARQNWKPAIIWVIGILVCALAAFVTPLVMTSHDAFGRKHTTQDKFKISIFGSTDHLRHELNYRTCHVSRIWKLTAAFTVLVRWVVPFALIMTFSLPNTRAESNYQFLSYRPFFNDQYDVFYPLEQVLKQWRVVSGKEWVVGISWATGFILVLTPLYLLAFPHHITWALPPDTNENFFEVNKAVEVFAAHAAQTDIPVRFNQSLAGTYVDKDQTAANPLRRVALSPRRTDQIDEDETETLMGIETGERGEEEQQHLDR